MLFPTIVHTSREHQLYLRKLSKVILLTLDDANDVLFGAFTERVVSRLLIGLEIFLFLLPQFIIKFYEFVVLYILRT